MLARHLFETGSLKKAEEFRFYLSGGFKAAIPYLIGLAEAVRSVDGRCLRDLGAEQAHAGPRPVAGQGVRAARDGRAGRAVDPAAAAPAGRGGGPRGTGRIRPGRKVPGELRGTFSTATRTRRWAAREYELTAFGAGLRALFGFGPEGFTG